MIDKIEYTKFNNEIWKDNNIKGYEKLVLIYLISYHNENYNYSFPTRKNISEGTGIGNNALSNALNSLEEKGYIKRNKHKTKGGWNNIYYIYKYLVVKNGDNTSQENLDNNKSIIEKSVNEKLLKKANLIHKLSDEQLEEINKMDSSRLEKSIDRANKYAKCKYSFNYLKRIYDNINATNAEATKKIVTGNKTVKTKYHNSFNEHYKNYDYDELEHKLLQMQERRRKGLA